MATDDEFEFMSPAERRVQLIRESGVKPVTDESFDEMVRELNSNPLFRVTMEHFALYPRPHPYRYRPDLAAKDPLDPGNQLDEWAASQFGSVN